MKFDLEFGGLSFQFFRILLGEGDVYGEFLSRVFPDDLILKSGNKTSGAEFQRITLSLSAVKCLSVNETFKVDNNGVSVLRGSAFNVNETRLLLLIVREFLRNVRFGHFNGFLCQFKTLVSLDPDLGLNGDGRLETEAVFADFENFDVRSVNRFDLCFVYRRLVSLGIDLFHGVVVEHARAVHSLNHFSRSLALAEAGNVEFLYVFSVRFFDCFFELVGGNADLQLDNIRLFVGNFFKFHVDFISYFFTFTGIIAYNIYNFNTLKIFFKKGLNFRLFRYISCFLNARFPRTKERTIYATETMTVRTIRVAPRDGLPCMRANTSVLKGEVA